MEKIRNLMAELDKEKKNLIAEHGIKFKPDVERGKPFFGFYMSRPRNCMTCDNYVGRRICQIPGIMTDLYPWKYLPDFICKNYKPRKTGYTIDEF